MYWAFGRTEVCVEGEVHLDKEVLHEDVGEGTHDVWVMLDLSKAGLNGMACKMMLSLGWDILRLYVR